MRLAWRKKVVQRLKHRMIIEGPQANWALADKWPQRIKQEQESGDRTAWPPETVHMAHME